MASTSEADADKIDFVLKTPVPAFCIPSALYSIHIQDSNVESAVMQSAMSDASPHRPSPLVSPGKM